jgi:hypothetical protein
MRRSRSSTISATGWPLIRGFPRPSDEGDGWGRGVNTASAARFCEHWLRRYDWRAAEADLNRWPHFIATIDDLDIHFVHVVGEAQRQAAAAHHPWLAGLLL